MPWFKSAEWREAIESLDNWWEAVVEFVDCDCKEPPRRGIGSWTFDIIDACDDLAPHIDPTPIWALWKAIDKFHKRYAGDPPPHYHPKPSLRKMNCLLEDAQLTVHRLHRASSTNTKPSDDDSEKLVVPAKPPPPSQRLILKTIAESKDKRLTTEELLAILVSEDNPAMGESTLRIGLAALTSAGRLVNDRDDSGYRIPNGQF